MEWRKLRSFTFPMALTILVACSAGSPNSSAALDGTSWILESIGSEKPIPGTKLTAEFDEGRIRGSSGCNSYGGSYQTQGQRLKVGELGATLMACLDPEGVMEQEEAFLTILSTARSYEIVEGRLHILSSDRQQLTFFTKG